MTNPRMKGLEKRYRANCFCCGCEGLIKHMSSIYIKADGESPMRILCHVCPDCLPGWLDEMEVAMPE